MTIAIIICCAIIALIIQYVVLSNKISSTEKTITDLQTKIHHNELTHQQIITEQRKDNEIQGDLLQVPTLIIDATDFTEAGYVGKSADDMI